MAQKPISRTGSGSISASGFLPAQVCKLVLSSTTNSNEVAPNAVIQLNKNNNRNEEQTATEVRLVMIVWNGVICLWVCLTFLSVNVFLDDANSHKFCHGPRFIDYFSFSTFTSFD